MDCMNFAIKQKSVTFYYPFSPKWRKAMAGKTDKQWGLLLHITWQGTLGNIEQGTLSSWRQRDAQNTKIQVSYNIINNLDFVICDLKLQTIVKFSDK